MNGQVKTEPPGSLCGPAGALSCCNPQLPPSHLEGIQVDLPQAGQLLRGALAPAPHELGGLRRPFEGGEEEAPELPALQLRGQQGSGAVQRGAG